MAGVRAFVAHSFTDDDAEVVRAFLEHLTHIAKMNPNFSWDHARDAEPKLLTEKVLALISDKNTFIGICTRKELVVRPTALKEAWWHRNHVLAPKQALEWKTSNWILQEIGLAIGRGLSLILLVEDGIRDLGGLQGNVEYIKFDRKRPDLSFVSLEEMIHSLSPNALGSGTTAPDPKSASVEVDSPPKVPNDDSWRTPTSEWKRREYEIALMQMIDTGDDEGVAAIDKAYLKSPDADHADNKITWEAFKEYVRIFFDKGGSFGRLKVIAAAHSDNAEVHRYLARAYAKYQDDPKSAETYEFAAGKAGDPAKALRLLGSAAIQYARAGMSVETVRLTKLFKAKVQYTEAGELQVLRLLLEIGNITKEADASLALMERIVELEPDDLDTRFTLAFQQAEKGNDDIALFHYLRIPEGERHSAAWNNLGVEFDHFSMPAKSVNAYRRAAELESTLAMSNLARSYMGAGFVLEAQAECNKALKNEDIHQNVGHTLAELKELPAKEDEKQAELLSKAEPKSIFLRGLGRARGRPEPSKFPTHWTGPECALEIQISGDIFIARGTFEDQSVHWDQLINPAFGIASALTEPKKTMTQWQVEFVGKLSGRAIEGHVTRNKVGSTSGQSLSSLTLIGNPAQNKVLMYLNDSESEIRVLEKPDSKDPKFYPLSRAMPAL